MKYLFVCLLLTSSLFSSEVKDKTSVKIVKDKICIESLSVIDCFRASQINHLQFHKDKNLIMFYINSDFSDVVRQNKFEVTKEQYKKIYNSWIKK